MRKRSTTCPCGGENRPGQSNCLVCHAAWMRRNGRRHSDLSDEQRLKANVRSYTNVLVRRGKLVRERCWCGAVGLARHPDWSDPRRVVWACGAHWKKGKE